MAQPSIVNFYDPNVNGTDAHGRTLDQMLNWNHAQLERCHDYIQVLFPLPEGSMFSYNAPIIDAKTMEAFRSRTALRMGLSTALVCMLQFYGFTVMATLETPDDGEEETEAGASEGHVKPTTGKGKGKAVEADGEATTDYAKQHAKQAADQDEDRKDSAAPATSTIDTDAPDLTAEEVEALKKLSHSDLETEQAFKSMVGFYVVRGTNFKQASKNWAVRMDHNHLRITRILRCLRVLGLQHQCEAFYKALKEVYNDPKINIGERSMMFWTRAVREPLHTAPDGKECKWLLKWQEKNQAQD